MSKLLTHFHLIRPWFLLLLPLITVALWLKYQQQRNSVELSELCDPHLLAAIVDHADGNTAGSSNNSALTTLIALFCLFCLFIIGLAGPSWEKKPIPLIEPQNARVVVLGLAQSMTNTDLAPSRFQRAKFKTVDLIRSAPSVLQALVIYSGDAFVVSPLSDDHNTILNLLKAIDMDTLPTPGNRTDRGLETAAQLLDQTSLGHKEIILISDTASPLSLQTAQQLAAGNIQVSVLSVNTTNSANESVLKAIAKTGKGVYSRLQAGSADIVAHNAFLGRKIALNLSQQRSVAEQFGAEEYQDQGAWLLAIVLAFGSLLFRKGWLLSVAILAFAYSPQPSYAFEWRDLWQRQDQQVARHFTQGNFEEPLSAQSQKSKPWQGAAAYRKQDYEAAAAWFEGLEDADSAYNLGTTYAQQGDYNKAIAAYDKSLDLNPSLADAQHNKGIVQKLLEQQKSQQQDQQSNEQGKRGQDREQSDQSDQQQSQSESNKREGEQSNEENSDANQDQQDPSSQDAEESYQQEAQNEQQIAQTDEESEQQQDQQQAMETVTQALQSEDQQTLEHWLRKLPDDPGALLKRKFKVQHQQRQQQSNQ